MEEYLEMLESHYEEAFKNNAVVLEDGAVKAVDFTARNGDFHFRFIFDEQYHTLFVHGETELIARNHDNMTLAGIKDFFADPYYFAEKVRVSECPVFLHSRPKAVEEILERMSARLEFQDADFEKLREELETAKFDPESGFATGEDDLPYLRSLDNRFVENFINGYGKKISIHVVKVWIALKLAYASLHMPGVKKI